MVQRTMLIIVDGLQAAWALRTSSLNRAQRVILLPLGVGAAMYEQAHGSLLRRLGVTFLEVESLATEARERLQQGYPTLVFALGRRPICAGKSLLDLLAIEDANMWWLLETTEKSVFRSSLVNHLYFLELVSLVIQQTEPDEIYIDVECRALRRALRSFKSSAGVQAPRIVCRERRLSGFTNGAQFLGALLARRMYLFLRLIGLYALLHLLGVVGDLQRTRILVFSVFPLVWRNPWSGDPVDRMYGNLATVLNQWMPTRHLVLLSMSPYELWKRRYVFRETLDRLDAIPILLFATIRDFCSILRPAYLARLILARLAVAWQPPIRYGEFDIAPLIEFELHVSLYRNELPSNILWMRCIKRLCRMHPVEFVVHWGEFQPIEKAVWYGVRGSNARCVAFQHSTISPMFLSYHFASGEMVQHLNSSDDPAAMPLPSLIVTTGTYAANRLKREGFPSHRMRTCGAIRYRDLMERHHNGQTKPGVRKELGLGECSQIILMATTSKHADNVSMASCLSTVLAEENWSVTVLIKCHPLVSRDTEEALAAIVKGSNTRVSPVAFKSEIPLSTLIAASDVMITNSSTTGVEAMALAVMPIFFHNPYLYDLSVLYSLRRSILLASDVAELRIALTAALESNSDDLESRKIHWPKDLEALFHRMDTDAEMRFLAFLQDRSTASQ